MPRIETRMAFNAIEADDRTITGVAVPYGESSRMIVGERARPFREVFNRNAAKTGPDTVLITNHDPASIPLARVGAGTLSFEQRSNGLHLRASLPESRPEIREAVARGDIDSFSVGFIVDDDGDSWKHHKSGSVRTITSATVVEVSLVSHPAYPGARISGSNK